jgi:glycosyltransferase involved in cell wall biosynthesis
MSLRIGVVTGTLNPEIGGGFTLTDTLISALRSAETRHEFVFIDPMLQPPTSSGAPNAPSFPSSGSKNAMVAVSVAMRLLEQSGVAFFEKRKRLGIFGNRQRTFSDFLDCLRQSALDHLDSLKAPLPEFLDTTLQERLEWIARREKLDLVWFMIPNAVPVSVPFIATVLDLEHRKQPYFPEVSYTDWTWAAREENFSRLLPRATFVFTGTQEGKNEIIRFYRVDPPRVHVLPLPAPPTLPVSSAPAVGEIREKYGIRGEYLLYPAQFWAHKNHVNLLHGLDRLRREYDLQPSLVFTGSNKGNRAYVQSVARDLRLSDRVFDLGFVSREELAALYSGAAALVYPSFFGPDNLPPLEAYGYLCPVLAADVPGAREQLGQGALFFDPKDPRAIAASIRDVMRDASLRQSLIEAGAKVLEERTPQAYAATVCRLLDDFEPIRRCWQDDYGDVSQSLPVLGDAGLSFAASETGTGALVQGWGVSEAWGTWSVEDKCTLCFNLGPYTGKALSLAFKCRSFQSHKLIVGCYVDTGPKQLWEFTSPHGTAFRLHDCDEPYRLQILPEAVGPSGSVIITFIISEPVSAAELGINTDTRRLGIGLERMWVEAF